MSDTWYASSEQNLVRRPYCCGIVWTASMTSTTATYITFATPSTINCLGLFDTSPDSDMFNQASQRIDIVRTGRYLVHGAVYVSSASTRKQVIAAVNGTNSYLLAGMRSGGTIGNAMRSGTGILELTSGDYVTLVYYVQNTGGLGIGSTTIENYNSLSVIYIGDDA